MVIKNKNKMIYEPPNACFIKKDAIWCCLVNSFTLSENSFVESEKQNQDEERRDGLRRRKKVCA